MNRTLAGWLAMAATLVLALLVAACPAETEPDDAGEGGGAVDVNGDTAADVPVCLLGDPFVAAGAIQLRDAEPADARQVGALRWERHDGCERFVADLLTAGGDPADRTGAATAEVLRDRGVVRVFLQDVERAEPEATDAAFDGPLARAAYVVRSPDGRGVYIDVHLGDAAEAHVTTLDAPARLVVDLRAGGSPVPGPAPRQARVVVLEPRPGPASYPLRVTGYARTFEANVVARLEQDGRAAFSDFTTSTGYVDAWGHYSFTIETGPTGAVVLHVGEHSARDGTWEGVAVELETR